MKNKIIPIIGIALSLSSAHAMASSAPNIFKEGQKTSAEKVNENFSHYEDKFLEAYKNFPNVVQADKVEEGSIITENGVSYTVVKCDREVLIPDFNNENGYKTVHVSFLTGKAENSVDDVCDYLVYDTDINRDATTSLLKVKGGSDLLIKETSFGSQAISVGHKDKNIILKDAHKYSTRIISVMESDTNEI